MDDPESQFDICDKRRAVLEGRGHMSIVGGPGSGKTTLGLLKARRAALEVLRREQTVLFLSFSNSATRRILEAGLSILSGEVAHRVEIKTYHSFAWSILRSHGYLLSSRRRLTVISAHDAAVLRAGRNESDWSAEEDRLFVDEGRATYDQFAPRAAELLERSRVLQQCFTYTHPLIIVDEFQDTDEDQWRLIQALAEYSEIVALGDTEQRIYAWRKGVSPTRLPDFARTLKATVFDFHDENNRSPASGIAGYARGLLSPDTQVALPRDIRTKYFLPGQFDSGLRFALIETWRETVERTGSSELSVVVAARSRSTVRRISDSLGKSLTVRGREHRPISHDLRFDHMQTALAARVLAFVMASQAASQPERLAGTLERIGSVMLASGTKTGIVTSDRLSKWAARVRNGETLATKCVSSLGSVFEEVDEVGFVGSPREDWLTVRRALECAEAPEVKRTGEHARYLRLLRRGSAIEEKLAALWRKSGTYEGAESALDDAMSQEQLRDRHRDEAHVSVMTMHQLKAREYDSVLLVEDQHRTFRGKDQAPPYMETRRLLQVSFTRARCFVCILSARGHSTLDVVLAK